ncbi:MAG: hypothetical protein BroJett018_26880 [Chloroflexota bacterium]|nr:MAG: hypothetical protein BroJett018_26880 [Chloroflexota bacterium]
MGFKYGRNRLRPSEMDTDAVPITLIHAISTNTGQASGGGVKQTSSTRIPYEVFIR